MTKERYQYSRIEAYILGSLTPEEKTRFEEDLTNDHLLLEYYHVHLAEHETMEQIVAQDLRQKFSQWKIKSPEDPEKLILVSQKAKRNTGNNWFRYGMALISFGILALALCYLIDRNQLEGIGPEKGSKPEVIDTLRTNPVSPQLDSMQFLPDHENGNKKNLQTQEFDPNSGKQPTSSEELKGEQTIQYDMAYIEIANEFYTGPEELFTTLRSGETGENTDFNKAFTYFQLGKYQEALKLLDSQGLPENSNVLYFKGHILFKLNRFNEASVLFSNLTKDPVLPIYDDARWNLFLASTASLPLSKNEWEVLKKALQSDAGFSYKSELKNVITRIELKK